MNRDVVFYNHLAHESGAVTHMGDIRTSGGDGDDEQIVIDLAHMPFSYQLSSQFDTCKVAWMHQLV